MTNPFIAQRELRAGRALVLFANRGVVALSGTDRLSYLDALVSQHILGLQPGESVESLLLDPQGHIERALRITDDGQTSWIFVDENQAPELAGYLDRMTFRKDAAARDVSEQFATIGMFSEEMLSSLTARVPGAIAWRDPWERISSGGWQYASDVEHPADGWNYSELLIPAVSVEQGRVILEQALPGVPLVHENAWDALRIAAWRPRLTTEVDATSLPHELDWLRSAVHLDKGCYRGQETVAKVHNLGHPPRRLVQLHLDGTSNQLPEHDAIVRFAGESVGRVTSVGQHVDEGPIALAVIKRTVDSGAELTVDAPPGSAISELPATQVVIVPPDAGRVVDVPRLTRFGRVFRTPLDE